MTFDEVLDKFQDTFPFAKVEDYRPICHELFTDGKPGITIWLKNGDVIEYYPAAEADEDGYCHVAKRKDRGKGQ